MSLVRDARLFTQRVSAAPISGNIDNPEGGLDALMQVFKVEQNYTQFASIRKLSTYLKVF